jgi:carbamoyl-phosphate synthase small subunit
MKLVLADGSSIDGRSFGAAGSVRGEVVFNTGMTGYVETLTDPSYRGQILVLTYPLQGNYGVPEGEFESARIQVQGLVVSSLTERPSHRSSTRSLARWLADEGVPAITGVDTRTLTRRLREHGTMEGWLLDGHSLSSRAHANEHAVDMAHVAELVTPASVTRDTGDGPRILVIDTGAKESIMRALRARGASVVRAPFVEPWEAMLDDVDGVMLTNGPGDPAALGALVERLRVLLHRELPVFGICLGHQLLGLAAGARTYKLPYGHRSQNQPVIDVTTQRAYITSQNHGYAVDTSTMPAEWSLWFTNLNDGSNEGIRHRERPFFSVQFHPEAAAGPHDTAHLFDDFLATVAEHRR